MKVSLNTQILVGAVIGMVFGFFLNGHTEVQITQRILYGCDLVGGIFVNLLKMILIPLVFTSVAAGIGNLRMHQQMSRVWKITLIYFLASPAIAVLLGLVLVNTVKPGKGLEITIFQDAMSNFRVSDMSISQFVKIFFDGLFVNPITAMAQNQVLATVIFAILFGIALVRIQEHLKNISQFLNEFFEIIMLIVGWIMRLAPWGVMALILKLVATQNVSLFSSLVKFIAVVIGGTLFHGIVILPLILYLFSGVGPVRFFVGMRDALITAFSTSSSSATLPVTIRCVQKHLGVEKSIVCFVAPIGATLNMDGTALYEAVAAIFVANLVGIELNLQQQGIVFLMAILASIGAPGIPSAGMVTMIMVLQSVGLPVEAIAILLPIDRPLDAIRTMVNVEGDAICSLIVQKHTVDKR